MEAAGPSPSQDATRTVAETLAVEESGQTEKPGERSAVELQIASPLKNAETFETYCHHVQARLAEHALRRRHFLQNAHERLTQLLHAARAVEDHALYQELWQVRLATRELLESLRHLSPAGNGLHGSGPQGGTAPYHPNGYRGSVLEAPTSRAEMSANAPLLTQPPLQAVVGAPPRLPRRPLRPLDDIEADARKILERIEEWKVKYPLLSEQGALCVPNCLRMRALACRLRRLEEEAGDTEVAAVTEAMDTLIALLDAAGDEEYTIALDDELSPGPTAFQWGELADRYEEMARAQEAFEWWMEHRAVLSMDLVQPIAEAIAAVQQRFNRLLFRIGARDPYQQRLFDSLRLWAREAQCYLYSLRPKVPIAELIDRAATLEEALRRAVEAVSATP
ncbi:MAG: hypothetical protein RMJ43_15190 [Chloroherpetonaceae bacterium]|nr:hypothetical protein [Chthonomonadaceae bacterium]MDW8209178.1 hypothetical protein [Chloroherpetonaceae bacterium]